MEISFVIKNVSFNRKVVSDHWIMVNILCFSRWQIQQWSTWQELVTSWRSWMWVAVLSWLTAPLPFYCAAVLGCAPSACSTARTSPSMIQCLPYTYEWCLWPEELSANTNTLTNTDHIYIHVGDIVLICTGLFSDRPLLNCSTVCNTGNTVTMTSPTVWTNYYSSTRSEPTRDTQTGGWGHYKLTLATLWKILTYVIYGIS